ncbi:MAG TPA: ATP-binding protein [Candidatus Baltobacteraceae bacterium]|nr:ATP-binding protein [Candidatus Baltobacteraceae bacterium]
MNESCSGIRFVRLSLGSRWRDAVVLQTLLLSFSLLAGISAAQVKPVRSVLIIHQVGAYLPLTDNVDRGIRTSFDSSPYRIVFHREFLQAGMFTDSNQQFRDFIVSRYRNYQPDVIIVVGQAPLQFMAETHEKAFRGVPIVFCLPDRLLANLPDELHFTGVVGDIAAAMTLDAALRLRPGIKRVVVIGGLGDIDLERNAAIQNQLKSYESHLEISYFTGIPVPDLVQRLQDLPNDTIILLGNLGLDSAGNLYSTAESGAIVAGNANVPVFSLIDRSLNHGEVGGKVSDSIEQGKIAGGIALRILNGEKPQNIPIMTDVTTYMFDWRALQRWGFKESNLPAGSIVLNREPTLWERSKWIWISGLLIILFLSALAAYLHFSRKQLRQARDAQLQLSGLLINAQEMERSRLASELHDDFSQRLALLALELENASEALPDSSQATKRQLHKLLDSASELGADLHTVSRRLHPSTLESLGLVPGLKALCDEFTSRQGIEIVFSSKNIPRAVPPNVALCLFRVAQEGLQNLRKYSGASQGKVDLRKAGDRVFLSVSDNGRGFDAKEMRNRLGLGIRSMGERARLVGGKFEIQSEPGKGTRIDVCVPLQPENEIAEELNMQRKADAV